MFSAYRRWIIALGGAIVLLGLVQLALGPGKGAQATPPADPALPSGGVQLFQWSDEDVDLDNPEPGVAEWQTGDLNSGNSEYHEGEVVPFRLDIGPGIDAGPYQFSVCRDFSRGTKKAYLFLDDFNTDRKIPAGTTPAGRRLVVDSGTARSRRQRPCGRRRRR